MKTTVEIPDELLIAAKKMAVEERMPLRALVEEGLRIVTGESRRKRARRRTRRGKSLDLVVVAGALAPDLDVASRDRMYEWLGKHP